MESVLNVALFLVKILKSWLAENGVVNRLHAELKTNIISSKSEMDGLYLENSLYYIRKQGQLLTRIAITSLPHFFVRMTNFLEDLKKPGPDKDFEL